MDRKRARFHSRPGVTMGLQPPWPGGGVGRGREAAIPAYHIVNTVHSVRDTFARGASNRAERQGWSRSACYKFRIFDNR